VRRFISFTTPDASPTRLLLVLEYYDTNNDLRSEIEKLRRQPGRRLHFQHIESLHLSFSPRAQKTV
jgi:hypothetical protein